MNTQNGKILQDKSEILFLYESNYSIPNGDPFTGEQRYDEETKRILISDVRIKRFIRDHLEQNGYTIYVSDKTGAGKTSSKGMIKYLYENTFEKKITDVKKILNSCIDVRLFGGISTLKENESKIGNVKLQNAHTNLTGPVQFALLNPSLNKVDLRMHQNTSHFISDDAKTQGAIGTVTVVPYSINQIHGWANPFSAKQTDLTENDLNLMFKTLWESINNANTRTKSNQTSLLLVQLIYSNPQRKIYGADRLIRLTYKNDMRGEQIRSLDDFDLDFTKLIDVVKSGAINQVNYYTEIEKIENKLLPDDEKTKTIFKKMNFYDKDKKDEKDLP